jgi:RNA polymerase sigma factor (sigma-70 family)
VREESHPTEGVRLDVVMGVARFLARTREEPRGVNDRDSAEFAAWVRPHLAPMGVLAARLVGPVARDDVVQEAVTRAWQKRDTFDPARGTARAWLCAIVADQARKWRRRGARSRGAVPRVSDEGGSDGSRVDVERAISALPRRMRLAVECYYLADLSVAETAEVMRISVGTVKSTLADARGRMRTMLQEVSE